MLRLYTYLLRRGIRPAFAGCPGNPDKPFTASLLLFKPSVSMAERGGFEPPWELVAPKSISSRSRYDHFGTSPRLITSPKWVWLLLSFDEKIYS